MFGVVFALALMGAALVLGLSLSSAVMLTQDARSARRRANSDGPRHLRVESVMVLPASVPSGAAGGVTFAEEAIARHVAQARKDRVADRIERMAEARQDFDSGLGRVLDMRSRLPAPAQRGEL